MSSPLEPDAVLVVEDDAPLHHVFARVVEMAGGEAFLAMNAAEARQLLAERSYAAALLDKNLPDASGIDLLRLIKQQQPRAEVIMVTGFANIESVTQALRLGAFDYVDKPFDVALLAERLKAALARRRRLAADVAQNVEGSLDRLAGELEVVAGLASGALMRLRNAAALSEVAPPLRDLDQVVSSLGEAAESARHIAQTLSGLRAH